MFPVLFKEPPPRNCSFCECEDLQWRDERCYECRRARLEQYLRNRCKNCRVFLGYGMETPKPLCPACKALSKCYSKPRYLKAAVFSLPLLVNRRWQMWFNRGDLK